VPWVGLYDSPTGDETEMALNLIKLCVGVSEVEEMDSWVKLALGGHDSLDHVTRMFPKRREEILPDGSLYWVMRGMIMCRQPIADLEAVTGGDGIQRCRIVFLRLFGCDQRRVVRFKVGGISKLLMCRQI
jgi:hypothetical protein